MFKYLKRLDPRWPVEVALGGRRPLARAEQAGDLAAAQRPGVPVAPVEHQPQPRAADDRVERGDRVRRRRAAARRGTHARGPGERARSRCQYPPGGTRVAAAAADPERAGHRRDRRRDRRSRASRAVTRTARPSAATRQYSPAAREHQDLRRARLRAHAVRVDWRRERHARGAPLRRRARRHRAADDARRLPASRTTPPAGEIRLPLYGNHWRLEPGHRVRLDLTQVDSPTYRPSNLPARRSSSRAA